MDTQRGLICASEALAEGGKGARFSINWGTKALPAFAVRFDGRVHAYLNCCPHQGTELDWMEGEFFDDTRSYLLCATHGAAFMPASGNCIAGPCKGQMLLRVNVEEQDGEIYWIA
jgi:nitrite reductase/ring-hydroxylating ferredoxin subunit